MAAARRRRLRFTTLASLLLALLVLFTSAAAVPASPQDPARGALSIESIPTVVTGADTARVRGRLTNTSDETLVEPKVSVVTRPATTSRSDLSTWAKGTKPVSGRPAVSATLGDIAPGESEAFTLEVPAQALAPGVTSGAARVSVQSTGAAVHTFIGVHRAKEYVPLDVVWGVPLLLPPNPRLFATPSQERKEAWEETVGEGSRLAELTEQPADEGVAWLLDPSLLTLPPEPGPGVQEGPAAMTAERELRTAWRQHLRETIDGGRTIVLPEADADVAAGASDQTAQRLIAPRLSTGVEVAEELDATATVMWPADGVVTDRRARSLTRMHPGERRPTLLTDSSALAPSGFTAMGGAATKGGTPLLVSDTTLAGLVGDLETAEDATLARQRLVAETAALLRERPGTQRTLLVVPERGSTMSPEAYAELRASVEQIPWLAKGDLPRLLEQARSAPEEQVPRTAKEIAAATGRTTPKPLLSAQRAAQISQDESSVGVFASVRADGPTWRRTVHHSLDQLTSTRWRGEATTWRRLQERLHEEVTLSPDEIEVSSGEVNFFADTGRLQITVVNHTDVKLSHLVVDLRSENPSFRIDGPPDPVTIGPLSRQKLTVKATALAAGRAKVNVVVTTPEGQPLTEAATLRVRMRPTGDTVYWIIGVAAVVLLGAGTWRTVRRRARTPHTPDPDGPDGPDPLDGPDGPEGPDGPDDAPVTKDSA